MSTYTEDFDRACAFFEKHDRVDYDWNFLGLPKQNLSKNDIAAVYDQDQNTLIAMHKKGKLLVNTSTAGLVVMFAGAGYGAYNIPKALPKTEYDTAMPPSIFLPIAIMLAGMKIEDKHFGALKKIGDKFKADFGLS